MKFPFLLPPLHLIPDYYKDNMTATMKKCKVQSAEELKLKRKTQNLGGVTDMCKEFISTISSLKKPEKLSVHLKRMR
jgi:hypothetical protein